MDFKTLILRFRDLDIAENETIKRHQTIIDDKDYVWWAWWKKGNEKTPQDEFGALNTRAENAPIEVLLVDSGQRKLYKALCAQIKVNRNSKMESPEKDATPDYYRNGTYHAWFKFTSITECAEDELRTYSYVNVDSLFWEGEANYTCFDNKQICSIKELIQQERTVWFIRDTKDTDSQNEIVLLNSDYVQPNNFSKKYYQSHGSSLLWLSDLHLADSDFMVDNNEITKSLF